MGWDNLLTTGLNLYQHLQNNKIAKKYNVPTAAETQSQALYSALADPNSPLMQQYTQQAKNSNMADFLAQLRGMQNADRRQQSLGKAPTFFNPERADESVSFLTSRGLPQMNQMATQQAQQRILQAAAGIQGAQPMQAERLQIAGQNAFRNNAFNPAAIMDIFKQVQQPATTPNLTTTVSPQLNGFTQYGQYAPPQNNYTLQSGYNPMQTRY